MLIIWNHQRVTERRDDAASADAGDLILSTGEFLVTDGGVMARFKPPLAKLSGHYPWTMLPVGIAALRMLISDEDATACSTVVSRFGLSFEETDQLDNMIYFYIGPDGSITEGDSSLQHDVAKLIHWGAQLARRCPSADVADKLSRLPKMSDRELGHLVTGVLG